MTHDDGSEGPGRGLNGTSKPTGAISGTPLSPKAIARLTGATESERLRRALDDEHDRILEMMEQLCAERAERDRARDRVAHLEEQLARVAMMAEEWFESSASGHPLCDPSEDCAGCVADQLRAILNPVDDGSGS